ncbi:hepatic lectin-like isoform X1 [Ascaphus truei]|uniref:hepatic lectin-like isoform X1 n=1 Tax=Ascaphus truei TaxID=8439 RepID=UPI003F595B05
MPSKMQSTYENKMEKAQTLNSEDEDEYEYVDVYTPAVPTEERRGLDPGARREELALKNTPGSGKQSIKDRLIQVLVVLLSLMFLLWIIPTSLVFKHYSSVSKEMLELKKSIAETRQNVSQLLESTEKDRNSLMVEVRKLSKTLSAVCEYCPPGWKFVDVSCYKFSTGSLTWEEARNDCVRQDSILLVFTDKKEMDALLPVLGLLNRWIGLRLDNNVWKWLDGTFLTFTNWSPNEPNNAAGNEKCTEILSGSGTWNDCNCANKNDYICKKVGRC